MTLRIFEREFVGSVLFGTRRVVACVIGSISIRHLAPLLISISPLAKYPDFLLYSKYSPLGRNPLTLTTTLTFPAASLAVDTTLSLLDRKEGVDAVDTTPIPMPGINRGTIAIAINISLMLAIFLEN